jgi:alkanesulfonate monooxygenase SsuD/methylene tetrahydromethanopterin reductase-like flavin-dependent oxidoreductase (luciferase family)
MFQRDVPPERLAARAQLIESLGYDAMWVVEDLYFSGGIAQAGAALAATEKLTIGIGILPATARNPVYAAMELGTLARLYPGRVIAGIGHGMQDWMAEVGALARSPVRALEETIRVIGKMLAGETVTVDGDVVRVSAAHLEHLPATPPPLLAGVRGPRSLELAGRVCDGVVLAEPTSVAYSTWGRERVEAGATFAGRGRPTLVSYTWLSLDEDPDVAIQRLRPLLSSIPSGLSEPSVRQQLLPLPFASELLAVLDAATDQDRLASELKDQWIRELGVVGTPEECAAEVLRRGAAGVDQVVLVPIPDLIEQQVTAFGREALPILARA